MQKRMQLPTYAYFVSNGQACEAHPPPFTHDEAHEVESMTRQPDYPTPGHGDVRAQPTGMINITTPSELTKNTSKPPWILHENRIFGLPSMQSQTARQCVKRPSYMVSQSPR